MASRWAGEITAQCTECTACSNASRQATRGIAAGMPCKDCPWTRARAQHLHWPLYYFFASAILPTMMFTHHILTACVLALAASTPLQAQTLPAPLTDKPSLYVQVEGAREDSQSVSLGATVPWNHGWQKEWWGGLVRGHWDVYLSHWMTDGTAGRVHSTVLGITPTLRLRFDGGRSPWFTEGGIGINYASPLYVTRTKAFSTRFNFASHLALGYSHGAQRQHEWQLRIQHSSNGGLKKPNPGQNFVQVRYARHF